MTLQKDKDLVQIQPNILETSSGIAQPLLHRPCSNSSGRNIAHYAMTKYCFPAKFASSHNSLDIICRFFDILTRRNMLLGDDRPWTNMESWTYCLPSGHFIFAFQCNFFSIFIAV